MKRVSKFLKQNFRSEKFSILLDNFSGHVPFESSNLLTVFLEPKTSGHLQPCDLNVFGPMKQSYRRKLNHQLFEKAKNLEAKVALTEYEGIKLCWENFF